MKLSTKLIVAVVLIGALAFVPQINHSKEIQSADPGGGVRPTR